MIPSIIAIVVSGILSVWLRGPVRYWAFTIGVLTLTVPVKLAYQSFATGQWFNDFQYIIVEGFTHFLRFSESPGNAVIVYAILAGLVVSLVSTAFDSGQRADRVVVRQRNGQTPR